MKKQLLFNFTKFLSQKTTFRMAAFVVLTLLSAQHSFAQTWTILAEEDNITSAVSSHVSITVANDVPYVVYAEGTTTGATSGIAKVKKLNGAIWEQVGGDLSALAVSFTRIYSDKNGKLYVTYIDNNSATTTNKLAVKTYNTTNLAWEPLIAGNEYVSALAVTLGTNPAGACNVRSSLAFDSNNVPYITYSANGVPYVMKFDGSAWVGVGTSGLVSADTGASGNSIALDSNNVPYVAYVNAATTTTGAVKTFRYNGSSWDNVSPPNPVSTVATNVARHISIVIDNDNKPVVSYYNRQATTANVNSPIIRCAVDATVTPPTAAWDLLKITSSGSSDFKSNNLIKDAAGNLYSTFMYRIGTTGSRIQVFKRDVGTNTFNELINAPATVGVDTYTGNTTSINTPPEIAVGSNTTKPYVVYLKTSLLPFVAPLTAAPLTPVVRFFEALPNTAPVAVADAITVAPAGTSTTLSSGATSVLANDTDADNNPLTATVVTGPANGSLTLNSNGTFSYVHNGSATTSDSFTYKANDGALDSNTATVTMTIGANNAPVANTDAFSVKQGGTVVTAGVTSVLTNDTDAEGSPLSATVVTGPANGTLTLNSNGTFSYLHNNSETTTDSFTYKANDGTLDSDIATVNITITAPVATTNTWTGGTSTDFLAASNWTASDAPNPAVFSALASFGVPSTANSPVLGSNYSTVSGAASCVALTVNTNAVLTANANIATSSTSIISYLNGTLHINAGATCDLKMLYTGSSNGNTGTINVNTGGTLSGDNVWRVAAVAGSTGIININGGTLAYSGASSVTLGHTGTGIINLNSGTAAITGGFTINATGTLNVAGGVWNHGTANINNAGTISITGGTFNLLDPAATINAGATSTTGVINIAGGTLETAVGSSLTIGSTTTGTVNVNINAGSMNVNGTLSVLPTAMVNIDAGSIVLIGDQTAGIAALITANLIKTSGAALAAGKIISNTYDAGTNKTTVVAIAPLGVNDVVLDANAIVVYTQNQSIKIQSGNLMLSDVNVYDVKGSLVASKKSIGSNETSIPLNASNAVYVVKVTTADGNVVTKKIVQ